VTEFVRFKFVLEGPRPQVRYFDGSDDERRDGAPRASTQTLVTDTGSWPATFERAVTVSVESCDAGRCANCRDNARVRYVLRSTDQHGIKKWCAPCLREHWAIDVPG
jgi:hypothetical protein